MLLDSNIIIYAAQPEHSRITAVHRNPYACGVGHQLYRSARVPQTDGRRSAILGAIFPDGRKVAVVRDSGAVGDQVTTAAEDESWDSIVAGTAIAYERTLVTRNTDDFRWIEEIKLLDPLAEHGDPYQADDVKRADECPTGAGWPSE